MKKLDKKEIYNFLNKNIFYTSNYNEALNSLKKLFDFFSENNYTPEPEILIDIVNLKVINDLLNLVITQNKNNLSNIERIINDENILLLIETYCMLNNIELDIIELDDLNYEDSTLTNYVRNMPVLSIEEEKELGRKVKQGDLEAKKLFIEHNIRLVLSIANRFVGHGVSIEDLIQVGNCGLIKAVERFDADKGYKFSTYATWWIKQAIYKEIVDNSQIIRIASYMFYDINKYGRAKKELEYELKREPRESEIAEKMGITTEKLKNIIKYQYGFNSIYLLVGDDEKNELVEFLPSNDELIENTVIKNSLFDSIMKLFKDSGLTDREIYILTRRYGLGCKEKMLNELGLELNLSGERVRQIEAKAINKLKRSKHIEEFASYMDDPDNAMKSLLDYRKKSISRSKVQNRTYNVSNNINKNVEKNAILRVQKIKSFCEAYEFWPRHFNKPKNEVEKLSNKLCNWLYNSGYLHNRFKYTYVFDESGIALQIILDKLYITYNKKDNNIKTNADILENLKLVQTYCETYDEWPKISSKLPAEQQIHAAKARNWLYNSGYLDNVFKYTHIMDENNKSIKEILDELYNIYKIKNEEKELKQFEEEAISKVKEIKQYCEIYEEWPVQHRKRNNDKENKSHLLYSWLLKTGYIANKFKFDYLLDENGESLKDVLDILYKKCTASMQKKEKDNKAKRVIERVYEIKAFCELYGEWPKGNNIQNDKERASNTYYNWLYRTGYIVTRDFIYDDIKDENGILLIDILDELYSKYSKRSIKIGESSTRLVNNITSEDYINLKEILKKYDLSELYNLFNEQEIIIIFLRLGYIDNKYFTIEAISKFLQMSQENIKEVINKVFLINKGNIRTLIKTK